MKVRRRFCKLFFVVFIVLFTRDVQAQFLVDMIDTTVTEEKGLWAIYRKSDHLQISGYIQPQFQVAQSKGAKNYSGGDFSEHSDNRFMFRRARIRFDYAHYNESGLPQAQVVFQFDGTERGVVIRDFWGRIYENKWQLFSATTGMFARPFGYEVNYSSGDRETPERGRMSQILMKTERDLGVMATFEPRKKNNPLRLIKFDVGVFNGQGLAAPEEFDSYKDIISRLSLKPLAISKKVSISAGASLLQGGLVQNSRYIYKLMEKDGGKSFSVDSSINNIGRKAPRKYRGLDAQLSIKNNFGNTTLRAEYWWGTQTGYAAESNTPAAVTNQPFYIRNFDGAFFYLVQDIVSENHQVIVKYDFYDPNRKIQGDQIGVNATFNPGDIRYNTLGFGYLYRFNDHLKSVMWYDVVRNEHTALEGYTTDIKDNVLTLRVQYEF
jgi:hypothetical protein